jgi:glycosyltransferase involved in cell wall biosynthesis
VDDSLWQVLYQPGHHLQKIKGILSGFCRRFRILFLLHPYDYVFIHREASPLGPPLFEWLIAKVFRKKIIYDFDDAIWLPNTSEANQWVARMKWHGKVSSICWWAHKVSAGNRYLCDYALQYNKSVVLNPTTIDTEGLHNRIKKVAASKKVVVGWTGTHSTLPYLNELLPVMQSLEKQYDFEFCVIADQAPSWELRSLRFFPWKKETEITDLLRFDIGIMPLVDDRWAQGKCGFKALQYMALGIPAIISPVGVNKEIVQEGSNGYMCRSPYDWEQALIKLFSDTELRTRLGAQARHTVENRYSVRANASNFLSLFDS